MYYRESVGKTVIFFVSLIVLFACILGAISTFFYRSSLSDSATPNSSPGGIFSRIFPKAPGPATLTPYPTLITVAATPPGAPAPAQPTPISLVSPIPAPVVTIIVGNALTVSGGATVTPLNPVVVEIPIPVATQFVAIGDVDADGDMDSAIGQMTNEVKQSSSASVFIAILVFLGVSIAGFFRFRGIQFRRPNRNELEAAESRLIAHVAREIDELIL